jgi:hypothetical protein
MGRRHKLWICEDYIFLKAIILIAIGVYETFVLTSSIYGATESETESADTTRYLGIGVICNDSRQISQPLVAFDEKSANILLQLRQAVKS